MKFKYGSALITALMMTLATALPSLADTAVIQSSSGSQVNVRSEPSTTSQVRHLGLSGDRVNVLNQTSAPDGYAWYYVEFPTSGARGWIRGDLLKVTATVPVTPPTTNPPTTNPPTTNPPATNPPATNPPATNPPTTNPPTIVNPPTPVTPPTTVNPTTSERVSFAPGTSAATVGGKVQGTQSRDYIVNAASGQTLRTSTTGTSQFLQVQVFAPDGTNLYRGSSDWSVVLRNTGDYRIRVRLVPEEQKPDVTGEYSLTIAVL